MLAFTGTCSGCAWALGDCSNKMSALGTSVLACSNGLTRGASSMGVISTASNALSVTINASANVFSNYANRVSSLMSQLANTVSSKMREIANVVNNTRLEATVNINCGRLPHFRMEGEFNAETKQVPSVHVDWYKRGGVFTSPSIIGVGEAGNEAVLPLNSKTFKSIADGISENSSSHDNRTVNIALNYSASDNAKTMFNDLVTRLETLDIVKG